MEDKAFQLLTTMYSNINVRFDHVEKNISEVISDMSSLNDDVRKMGIIIENVLVPKIEVLFDGYKQTAEQLSRIEDQILKHGNRAK